MRVILRMFCVGICLSGIVLGQSSGTGRATDSKRKQAAERRTKQVVISPLTGKPNVVQNIKKGDILVLKLPVQPGTGYTWIVGQDLAGLKKIGGTTYVQSANEPGAAEMQIVKFAAVEVGQHKLSMSYSPVWDKSTVAQTVSVDVDVTNPATTESSKPD